MSTQLSSERPRKQPANIYTVMLLMSMVFMLVAVIAMFIELQRYAPDYYKTNVQRSQVSIVYGVAA